MKDAVRQHPFCLGVDGAWWTTVCSDETCPVGSTCCRVHMEEVTQVAVTVS